MKEFVMKVVAVMVAVFVTAIFLRWLVTDQPLISRIEPIVSAPFCPPPTPPAVIYKQPVVRYAPAVIQETYCPPPPVTRYYPPPPPVIQVPVPVFIPLPPVIYHRDDRHDHRGRDRVSRPPRHEPPPRREPPRHNRPPRHREERPHKGERP